MVSRRLFFIKKLLFLIKEWWLQVTLIPEDKRITVFRRGTWNGFRDKVPNGGQEIPISMLGARLLWKKAQKKEKKNKISEIMNKSIPKRSPLITNKEWYPCQELSRHTSRHHRVEAKVTKKRLIIKAVKFLEIIQIIILNNLFIERKPVIRGQGLGEMMWKGWNWLFIGVFN